MTAVVLRMARRMSDATPLMRRILAPVVAIAGACAGALGDRDRRRRGRSGAWPSVAAWLLALALPAIALAFLAGVLRWRLFAEQALRRLAACLRVRCPNAVTLRAGVRRRLRRPDDRDRLPGRRARRGWMDCCGPARDAPGAGQRAQRQLRCSHTGTVVAAIVHDEELASAPGARARPASRWPASSSRTSASPPRRRRRSASCADRAPGSRRPRSASGAGSSATCTTAPSSGWWRSGSSSSSRSDLVRRDPERGALRLQRARAGRRRRARGAASAGARRLPAAARRPRAHRGAGRGRARSTIAVELEARDVGRYPPEVESAVYFCVLEALQNVHKHATVGASRRRARRRAARTPAAVQRAR